MSNIDKISFPYRAATHLNLLHVVGEIWLLGRYGLDVNYDYQIPKERCSSGGRERRGRIRRRQSRLDVRHRARGDKWVYLGQTLEFRASEARGAAGFRHQRHR